MTASAGSVREGSLDGFRGLTVVLMVIVNLQIAQVAWPQLAHAPWHGLTLADLIFPCFLLIVGLSMPLARDGRPLPIGAVLQRATLLFALGVALAWLIRPTADIGAVRWMGVLQRIALVYLACLTVARWSNRWLPAAAVAVLLLLSHALLLGWPPPGGSASLAPGEGMAGWVDRAVLPGRLYPPGWDPEGVLSTLGAISTGLIGVALMRVSRSAGGTHDGMIAAIGILLMLAGAAAATLAAIPLNKALWTPSFVLVTAGLVVLIWTGARWLWPLVENRRPARLLAFCGRAALTVYVVNMLLIAVLVCKTSTGARLWNLGYAPFGELGLTPAAASLSFGLAGTGLCIVLTALLFRRGLILRL